MAVIKERGRQMRNNKARKVALTGMLFALSITLSFLESMVTPLLGLMPAMKLGLSNIVVMYALVFLQPAQAGALVLLKALFALMTRGVTAGFLSLLGGSCSFLTLWILLRLPWRPTGYIFSVTGALTHNLGQLFGAALILSSNLALGYAPVLMVAGVVVGSLTSCISHALFPALSRLLPGTDGRKPRISF